MCFDTRNCIPGAFDYFARKDDEIDIRLREIWLQERCTSLEKQIKEKDAMIAWLADICRYFCEDQPYCNACALYPGICPIRSEISFRFEKFSVGNWRREAQDAVREEQCGK